MHARFWWEKINACKVLVGKLKGKKQLGWPRCRCGHNIEMNNNKREWEGLD